MTVIEGSVSEDGTSDRAPAGRDRAPEFVSYAQNLEDALLWRAVGSFGPGFYIDVGAGEPAADSVTQAFYLRGWRGINIEPMPGPYERIREARERDINLNVALEDKSAESKTYFSIDVDSGLSTGARALANTYRDLGREVREINVKVMTLEDVFDTFVSNEVHFLKVDVETNEGLVFAGGDFARHRPWIVLAETPVSEPEPTELEWHKILVDADYAFVYFDGLNRYYVAREKYDLLAGAFSVPINWFDNVVTANEKFANDRDAELQDQLQALGVVIETLTTQVEDLQKIQTNLLEDIDKRDERIHDVEAELIEARKRIETQQSELDACYQELFEDSRHIAWLSAQRSQIGFAAHNDRIRADEAERVASGIPLLEKRIQEQAQEIHDLRTSTSWRVTTPMRRASAAVRRKSS